jgi:hypothetical protein
MFMLPGALSVETHAVSMSFILCDGKHMRVSMIFLILDWKHMRVYVRKHMCVAGYMPFTALANFCFCAAAFSAAAMSFRKQNSH